MTYKGKFRRRDAVDAGPFLEWLESWKAGQEARSYYSIERWGGARNSGGHYSAIDRSVAGLTDLAELAGCSPKVFSRARLSGRISIANVDRVLVAAGGDVLLIHLYPELYEGVAA